MEKMREEFEAEYIKSLNNNYFSCEEEKLVYIKRHDNGDYVHDLTYSAFHWWKASRSALCVDVSKAYQQGGMMADYLVESALEEAGVTYK